MGWVSTEARRGLRNCVLILAAIVAALSITTNAADARYHRRVHIHFVRHRVRHHHRVAVGGYSPPTASIVIDGNTGAVLEESNPDAPRHPASLTKVMTLYLLFERLAAGTIKFDTRLVVSAHAAAQAPTKLGLKPGQTISVEDAIKGIVTRSANDAAVVIAENLGGSEQAFARQMTQKARELGMRRTTYVNASGLPDEDQITTARDLALLARAIYQRFPQYYHFFSTTSFVFRGQTIRGHDHLLGSVPGVDGMKTGFTDASGFNLITTVHRDGRYLVAVVLGGRSAAERDAHMRALIASNIRLAAVRRTAPMLAERAEPEHGPQRIALAERVEPRREMRREAVAATLAAALAKKPMPERIDPAPTATASPPAMVGSSAPIRPVLVKTISYRAVTVSAPSMSPMPVLVPATAAPRMVIASADPMPATNSPAGVEPQRIEFPKAEFPKAEFPKAEPVQRQPDAVDHTRRERKESASADPLPSTPPQVPTQVPPQVPTQVPPHVHDGWLIQIGAFGGKDEARQHLSEAQAKLHSVLAAADPFTEPVHKGDTTLYRARFAGFDKATAEAACRQLKRHDFRCMTLKD